jgi:hypothetical protein
VYLGIPYTLGGPLAGFHTHSMACAFTCRLVSPVLATHECMWSQQLTRCLCSRRAGCQGGETHRHSGRFKAPTGNFLWRKPGNGLSRYGPTSTIYLLQHYCAKLSGEPMQRMYRGVRWRMSTNFSRHQVIRLHVYACQWAGYHYSAYLIVGGGIF